MLPALPNNMLRPRHHSEQHQRRQLRPHIPPEPHRQLANHHTILRHLHFRVERRVRQRLAPERRDVAQAVDNLIKRLRVAVLCRDARALVKARDDARVDRIVGRRHEDEEEARHNGVPRRREHVGVVDVGVAEHQRPRCLRLEEELLPGVVEGVLVVVFVGEDDLVGADRVEDVLQVLGGEVLAAVLPAEVAGEVLELHARLALDGRVVLVRIQHDDGVRKDKDGVLVRDALGNRARAVLFRKRAHDALDERGLARQPKAFQKNPERLVHSLARKVIAVDEGIQNRLVALLGQKVSQDLLVNPRSPLQKLGQTLRIGGVFNHTLLLQIGQTPLRILIELAGALDDELLPGPAFPQHVRIRVSRRLGRLVEPLGNKLDEPQESIQTERGNASRAPGRRVGESVPR